MANLAGTLKVLTLERSQMAGQVRTLDKVISVLRKLGKGTRLALVAGGRKNRTMSAAGRRKIAAAQKARWAKWRATQRKKAA
jgi:hypothetical protein